MLIEIFDGNNKNSIAYQFRKKRMAVFEKFFEEISKEESGNKIIKVLDIGGTLKFWEAMECKYFNNMHIALLNKEEQEIPLHYKNIISVIGDATDMSQYKNQEFDIVFSNSVIEHVGDFEKQKRMVEEVKRVGKHYFLQTPNRNFFIEPHFHVPFFQFFPLRFQVFLLQKKKHNRIKEYDKALELAKSVRLINKKELTMLFPNVKIRKEKFLFMTKSYYLYI